MKITQDYNPQKNLLDQIAITFSPTFDEQEKLKNLLQNKTLSLFIETGKIAARFSHQQLTTLIETWPEVFGHHSGEQVLLDILHATQRHFKGTGFDFDITTTPVIYSVLNLTPDSFYDGGVNNSVDGVLRRIEMELAAGAGVFEVGGKSSKPHFDDISADEEWNRLVPYLKAIHKRFPDLILAIDSNTPKVIDHALQDGIQIINDIDGFNSQEKLDLVAKYKPSVVTMFNGRNFDEQPETLAQTMTTFFTQSIAELTAAGLAKENIVLDPGVGFSDHNTLEFDMIKMNYTKVMAQFEAPIMIAISRKSFSKRLFNLDSADDRLIPTLLFESFMTVLGGRLIRVHDVKETRQLVDTFNLLKDGLLQ